MHLELPEDVASQPTDISHMVPVTAAFPPIVAAEDAAIQQAAGKIAEAAYPLIVLPEPAPTGLASRPHYPRPCTPHGNPFLQYPDGQGRSQAAIRICKHLGTAALSSDDYVHLASDYADLIIAVGHDTVEKPPFIMRPSGPEVVHVDFNPADIDQIYFPRIEVIGDIADSMTAYRCRALEGT